MNVGLHTRLRPGTEERYEDAHRTVWPEVLEGIRRVGITKYVIYRDGLDLFHHIECEEYDQAVAELSHDPVNRRWEAWIAPMMEVAHDFSGEGRDRLNQIFELQ
jgi:L-rhamnose mutarotase